ncbi:hypothetical protein AMECASPLE_000604 [Ameca splendens]|uniref:Uncharacterized protein n=1 Tax=Ameca splendens TaxID=208324 RepID=A0ABV0XLT3_9TELE
MFQSVQRAPGSSPEECAGEIIGKSCFVFTWKPEWDGRSSPDLASALPPPTPSLLQVCSSRSPKLLFADEPELRLNLQTRLIGALKKLNRLQVCRMKGQFTGRLLKAIVALASCNLE